MSQSFSNSTYSERYSKSKYISLNHQVAQWSHAFYFEGEYYNPEQWEKMWQEAFEYMLCCQQGWHCQKCQTLWCQEMTKVNWKSGAKDNFCHLRL